MKASPFSGKEVTYSISELAQEFDITPRTIRYYEDEGLITPSREGQTRIYSHKDKIRLKLTLRGKRLGFSLAEIRELFDMYDTCLLYTSPSPRDRTRSRMPSSA